MMGPKKRIQRGVGLLALEAGAVVTALGGCEAILGIEDTVVATSGFPVYGTAVGLIEPVSLQLDYGSPGGESEILRILQDGRFAFASELTTGTSYTVTFAADDDDSECMLESASGVIAEASPEVRLICPLALANLELMSARVPALGFVPTTLNYEVEVSLLQDAISIIATAQDKAIEIAVGDIAVTSGEPSEAIPLRLGTNEIPVVARDPDSGASVRYLLTIHRAAPIAQYASGKAAHIGMDDKFGYSLALSAGGDTLAVGVPNEDSGIGGNQDDDSAPESGAVYVFARTGTNWTQEAYLKASNAGTYDHFGDVIALSASGDTLAVGAHYEDSSATSVNGNQANDGAANSGAVYVFARTGTSWSQEAYLKASNTDAEDKFGYSLALSGTGDRLAVGATREDSASKGINGDQSDNNMPESGAVYVFARTGTSWSQEAYLKASNPDAGDYYGNSVALSASGDTLAVGALKEASAASGVDGNQDDNSMPDSGAVYVLVRAGTRWSQEAYLKASHPGAEDAFGFCVALSASGDTLAVGAPEEDSVAAGIDGNQEDDSAGQSGAVYVFAQANASWSQEAYVKASNTGQSDQFGNSVALSASGDTLAVGAPFEDSSARGIDGNQGDSGALASGAVYVFTRADASWSQQAYVKASNTGPNDYFGWSVALSAAADTLAVGAPEEDSEARGLGDSGADNTAHNSGAVYLFY